MSKKLIDSKKGLKKLPKNKVIQYAMLLIKTRENLLDELNLVGAEAEYLAGALEDKKVELALEKEKVEHKNKLLLSLVKS